MKNSNNFRARAFLGFFSMGFVFSSAWAESQETLAVRAYRVLVEHCSQCHGKGAAQSDEMLLEHEALLKDGLIRPGSAAKSKLYRVMLKGEMPRKKNDNPGFFPRYDLSGPPVPKKEMAIVKRWIETGALDWGNPKRKIKASPPESYLQPDTIGFPDLFAYKDFFKKLFIF